MLRQATFSTSALSVSSHSITAEYAGDANFNASASGMLNQVVNKRATMTNSGIGTKFNPGGAGEYRDCQRGGYRRAAELLPDGMIVISSSVPRARPSSMPPALCFPRVQEYRLVRSRLPALDDGVQTITANVLDNDYPSDERLIRKHSRCPNAAPVITSLTGQPILWPSAPRLVNITANFTDAGSQDTHQCTFSWDDPTPTTQVTAAGTGNGSCTATHSYTAAGVYGVGVTVSDDDGGTASSVFEYVVVYDPNGSFVTGGGFIISPAGAFMANTSLTGKANFGFVSKYLKGATKPTGETEFQFQLGDLDFHSSVYDWLVVSGAKAQYKGTGTINNSGNYGFLLTATDGQLNGGGGVDKFRIKIWDKVSSQVIYDNVPTASDDLDTANPQALSGGSIVIHK
jgi:hypothetical protein